MRGVFIVIFASTVEKFKHTFYVCPICVQYLIIYLLEYTIIIYDMMIWNLEIVDFVKTRIHNWKYLENASL